MSFSDSSSVFVGYGSDIFSISSFLDFDEIKFGT